MVSEFAYNTQTSVRKEPLASCNVNGNKIPGFLRSEKFLD